MNDPEWEEFSKAHHREKDGKAGTRMVAVYMVLKKNMTHGEAADILIRCPEWVVVYGAPSISGRRFYRTYSAFNPANFETYIRKLHRRLGRIAVIVDRSGTHSSARIRAFLDGNPDVKPIELPVGSPQLNAPVYLYRKALKGRTNF